MLFGKRKKPGGVQAQLAEGNASPGIRKSDVFRIEFDMMLKGSVYRRRGGDVRQFGVTVRGATCLVTSGDLVDRTTYEALLAVGAIRPAPPRKLDGPPKEDTPPAKAPEMQDTQAQPPEKPGQPPSLDAKFQEPEPQPPLAPEAVPEPPLPEAASAFENRMEAALKDAPAEASTESPSPSPPPDGPEQAEAKSSSQEPGPRGRSGKSRRRKGSR